MRCVRRIAAAAVLVTSTAAARDDAGAPRGLAVVSLGEATDSAWALARDVYRRPSLRPSRLDEAHARALAGDHVAPDAPASIRELSDTRAALRGDDAPSRRLLATLASELHVRGIVTVAVEGGDADAPGGAPRESEDAAVARVFLAASGTYDAASYRSDPALGWKPAVDSLERSFASPPDASAHPAPAAALGRTGEGKVGGATRPFYASGWFWGALGTAAFCGAVLFFATRDSSPDRIHVDVQVPR